MRRIKPTLRFVVLLINLAFCFAFTSTAQAAESIRGRIKKVDNTYLIITNRQIAYTLDFTNSVSEQQIRRLNNGDYASVSANLSSIYPSHIQVTSVDYIGLNILTGTWLSDAKLCYDFASFTRLYVYKPNNNGKCVRSLDPKEYSKYTYFINPDVDAWNMLISSNNSEFVGNLDIISADKITIELFDARTDVTLGTMVLRR